MLLAGQKLARLVQPSPEARPLAQQSLVGNLYDPVVALLAHDQQPRLRQSLQQRMGLRGQIVPFGRTADVFALIVHPHHRGHERVAQRRHLFVTRLRLGQHVVRGLAHRILERRELRLRIAQRIVGGKTEIMVAGAAVVELAKREGQQRQGVHGFGIPNGLLREAVLDAEARHPRRPLDDLGDPGERHGPE